jgi:hypothetical protein
MATTRYHRNGMQIDTYAGAEVSPHSNSRMMVQISCGRKYVGLTMDQWIDLVCFIRELDETGKGIRDKAEVYKEDE